MLVTDGVIYFIPRWYIHIFLEVGPFGSTVPEMAIQTFVHKCDVLVFLGKRNDGRMLL